MKRIKKLASLMLAMIMVLGMTMTAFAASTGGAAGDPNPGAGNGESKTVNTVDTPNMVQHTIFIKNSNEGHEYQAYQVLRGDYSKEDSEEILSNITWGSGVKPAELLAALKADDVLMADFASCENAVDVAEALEKCGEDDTKIKAFADVVTKCLTTPAGSAKVVTENSKGEKGYAITVEGDGYYLVKDADNTTTSTEDTITRYMLQVVGDVSTQPKTSTIPTPDKEVKDVNDSEEIGDSNPTDWQSSADYDIGDSIPYRLSAILPEGMEYYEEYKLVFHDELSKGLQYDSQKGVKVYLNNENNTIDASLYEVTEPTEADKKELTITFDNVKGIANVKAGDTIYIEYYATLTEDAVIGSGGNDNKLTLEYSNNPNSDGTGTTSPQTAVVFTFKLGIDKVDDDKQPLAGAGFTLTKYDSKTGNWVESRPEVKGEEGTRFEFTGLDDGWYKLEETTVPTGYNKMEDLYFRVTATHDKDNGTGGESGALKTLDVVITDAQGNTEDEGGDIKVTPDFTINESANASTTQTITDTNGTEKVKSVANMNTVIQNNKGSLLPSTGGIGTTIFYVVGGILVIGAGILLVAKKRMGAHK